MLDREAVLDVLRRIDDPEMPINIVDLGLVADIRIEPASAGASHRLEAGATNNPAHRIEAGATRIVIDLTPTFIGCPALDFISQQVLREIRAQAGAAHVEVCWVHSPPWSVERISDAGRQRLRDFGVTTPTRGSVGVAGAALSAANGATALTIGGRPMAAPACPYCGTDQVEMDSPFGPTRCRMIYYCPACKNSFEHLKPI